MIAWGLGKLALMKYSFGGFTLDLNRGELLGKDGPVPVEPRAFTLLAYMVEQQGRLVEKDELIASVWGGLIVSDAAIATAVKAVRRALGDSGKEQVWLKTVRGRGFRFDGDGEVRAKVPTYGASAQTLNPPEAPRQTVHYTCSQDGTLLAFAVSGKGPKIMRAGHFLTHLEEEWNSAVSRPYLEMLGAQHTVVRYDQRGTGLSAGDPQNLSVAAQASDLLAVADAASMDRFPLIASSQGVATAIHVAAHNPGRISRMVLYGGFPQGREKREDSRSQDEAQAMRTMVRAGWGNPNSPFMVAFTSLYCPTARREELNSLANIQLASASPEMAIRVRQAIDNIDVMDLLPKVEVPTLIIHARHEALNPISQARILAARIPNAEFKEIDSPNHIVLPSDPNFQEIVRAQIEFIDRKF